MIPGSNSIHSKEGAVAALFLWNSPVIQSLHQQFRVKPFHQPSIGLLEYDHRNRKQHGPDEEV
ncbi:hypothetical protein D3H65_02790 [Paraflavitalea soli]|uniref:Uncharacterized protein n=1 Tax=Paraflavitalea soli TaxID=2315862 RepID=A0A3B7MIS3_9BACT|nr:hypothetical protein D3H65_02790 [Paraflavitalea soli]